MHDMQQLCLASGCFHPAQVGGSNAFTPLVLPPCEAHSTTPAPCRYRLAPQALAWRQTAALCTEHGRCAFGHGMILGAGQDVSTSAAEASCHPGWPGTITQASLGWGGVLLSVNSEGQAAYAQVLDRCLSTETLTPGQPQPFQWHQLLQQPPAVASFKQAEAGESEVLLLDGSGAMWHLQRRHHVGSPAGAGPSAPPGAAPSLWPGAPAVVDPSEATPPSAVPDPTDATPPSAVPDLKMAMPPLATTSARCTWRATAAAPEDAAAVAAGNVGVEGGPGLSSEQPGSTTAAEELMLVPLSISPGVRIAQVACGAAHCLAVSSLDSGGLVFGWGWNGLGAAGLGRQQYSAVPHPVEALAGVVRVVQVAAGLAHSLLLSDLGDVYSCGSNADGQLGLRDTTARLEPTLVEELTQPVGKVSCGGRHSLAIGADGRALWTWGWAAWGQLGLGRGVHRVISPELLPVGQLRAQQGAGWRIVDVEGGRWHTLVLLEGGAGVEVAQGSGGFSHKV